MFVVRMFMCAWCVLRVACMCVSRGFVGRLVRVRAVSKWV